MNSIKKLEEQIPNPFPSLGTSTSMAIELNPIGYEDEIKKIHKTIRHNITHQAMIFNIVGNYGYGKTLFLNYFYNCYKNDYFCQFYNLSKFESLGPFFLEKI